MTYSLYKKMALLRFLLLFCFYFLSFAAISTAQEVKKEMPPEKAEHTASAPAQKEEKKDSEPVQESPQAQSLDAVEADTGLEAMEEMEKSLQQTILQEARSYYPSVTGIHTESLQDVFVLELEYDAQQGAESIPVQIQMQRENMGADVIFKSPLLYPGTDTALEGDTQWVKTVSLVPNSTLSQKLGEDAKIFFLGKITFDFSEKTALKILQRAGVLRLELKKMAREEEEEKKEESPEEKADILFDAPGLQPAAQILGESYQNERRYEERLVNDQDPSGLDQLLGGESAFSTGREVNYASGVSAEAVKADMNQRYPQFGTLEYWKKYVSGLVTNTMRFTKLTRGQHPILMDTPGIALLYDRPGTARVKAGYNIQREFPFFYGKLGRRSPADGFMRQDILGGITYSPDKPWVYSIQNRLSVGMTENLSSSSKFGDRLNTYYYEAGQGLRYNLKRGYVQLGSGLRWLKEERGLNEDATGYLTAFWYRPLHKRFAVRSEYSFAHNFTYKPGTAPDINVHKAIAGFDYTPVKGVTLSPSMGLAFHDDEAFWGVIGGMKYKHKLDKRSQLTLSYNTDFIRRQAFIFGQDSLVSRFSRLIGSTEMIRYHLVSAAYERNLNRRLKFTLIGEYLCERAFQTEPADQADEYRISAVLAQKLAQDWRLEWRYVFVYLDAMKRSSLTGANDIDLGNTEHSFYFKLSRYLGESRK